MSEPVQLQTASRVRALEYDPCPADVPGIRAVSARLRQRAAGLTTAAAAASGWVPARWRDDAALATVDHLAGLVERSRALRDSLDRAAEALEDWAAAVGCLQQEAALLDARAADVRRRMAVEVIVATAPVTRPGALHHELREIRDRTGELHQRYVGQSRRHATRLDGCAPRASWGVRWWHDATDSAGDAWRTGVRRNARTSEWVSIGLSHASVGTALVAGAVPATAPVAGPLSLALAVGATQQRAILTLGAAGSTAALAAASTATVTGVVGGLAALARLGRVGRAAEGASTGGSVVLEMDGWDRRSGAGWTARVATEGGEELDVEVHDMAEPWHTGHGLRGHGFVGVATLTVPSATLARQTVPSTTVPSTTVPSTTVPSTTVPSTTVPSTTVPTTSAPGGHVGSPAPVSRERDDQDGVRRRRG